MSGGPLSGYRVLEVGRFVTGPYAAQLLADLGASVIKVEDPGIGDPFRGGAARGHYYSPFLAFNRGKRSIALDLRQPRACAILRQLAGRADVFIENFRPGTAARLGIDYPALRETNPRLIYCSISGVGRDGPSADQPVYDIVGQGVSGLLGLLMDPDKPQVMGPAFSDSLTGLFAAYGIIAALHGRERTGRGELVETNLLQATMAFMMEPYAAQLAGNRPTAVSRPRASQVYVLRCSDGLLLSVQLSTLDKFWRLFTTAAGIPEIGDEPAFRTYEDRRNNWALIDERLKPVFATRPRAAWLAVLTEAGVPATPIHDLEQALSDPQVRHLEMVACLDHPVKGEVRTIAPAIRFAEQRLPPASAPPTLGEHSEEILGELGIKASEIAELRDEGVI